MLRRPGFLIQLLFCLSVIGTKVCAADLQQQLRNQYQGKILLLRSFYVADQLSYSSAGTLLSKSESGDWTSDGFVAIREIAISGKRLLIETRRVAAVWDGKTFQLEEEGHGGKKKSGLLIEADLGNETPAPGLVDAVLSKIFLTAQDRLVTSVPAYWRSCLTGGPDSKDAHCRLSDEILGVPGVSRSPNSDSMAGEKIEDGKTPTSALVRRVGGPIYPPRPIYKPDPDFTERARQVKVHGTVTLGLTVDKNGAPTNIRIVEPLGAGLDAKAVQAMERWKFSPAMKDGQPVPVAIQVQMDFHLY